MDELKKVEAPPSHFDVRDELTESEIQKAHEKADECFEKENDHELNLTKSPEVVPGQDWALVSFVGQTCNQKTDKFGLKIWAVLPDIDSAKDTLKDIGKREENKHFDIYIMETRAWVIIPPDNNCIDDEIYHDKQLNDLIDNHKKEQYRAQSVFDMRKNKLKSNPDINQHNKNKNVLKQLKNDLTDEPQIQEIIENDEPQIQNAEAVKKVFGEPTKLPEFTIEEVKGVQEKTDLPVIKDEESTPSDILKDLENNV